jgi:hypothetical protein
MSVATLILHSLDAVHLYMPNLMLVLMHNAAWTAGQIGISEHGSNDL